MQQSASSGAGPNPRMADLDDAEFAELRRLTELYDMIRDAPTGPRTTQTLARVVGSLVVPTVTFFATVVAEQYTGQLLEKILP